MTTPFKKIIQGEIPADKVYESQTLIVIKDIAPKAPIHLLLIPKKAYPNLQEIPEKELHIVQEIIAVTQQLAKKFSIANHYRLVTNIGSKAGQEILHLHFHLIGGKSLGPIA